MTKPLALAFLCADRVDLSEQSIEPLLHDDIDLWVIDGSKTYKGIQWAENWASCRDLRVRLNIRGGAGAAIVYALTTLLKETDSPYVGLIENDCLLHKDWLSSVLALFDRGCADGLVVGAVSARTYEDRILCQRDGYALMHNLGAGMIVLTREAAQLILRHFRTPFSTENRVTFCHLANVDLARWWAFGPHEHFLTADWGWDALLASHGLASLALVPSRATMIDQDLAPLGLKLATEPVETLRDDALFARYRDRQTQIRNGTLRIARDDPFCHVTGGQIVFCHQVGFLGGTYSGNWRLREMRGFGTFAWEAADDTASLTVPVFGHCSLVVGGGPKGGRCRVHDSTTGYDTTVDVRPEGETGETLQLMVPGNVVYREVALQALDPGVCFLGLHTTHAQPWLTDATFDYEVLPKP